MKTVGFWLLLVGVVLVILAFNEDTTVTTDSHFIGGAYIPGAKVHNLGLMDDRRNHLMMSSLLVVVGVILFAFGSFNGKKGETPSNGMQASTDKQEDKTSRYCGEPSLQSGKYQLFLTKKYAIEKNATLEKYVVDDNLFQTLEDALAFCDNKEKHVERERLRKAYKINYVRKNSNAELAGIEVGDILVAYNRQAIASDIDISDAIESASEPTTTLVVFRDQKPLILKVSAGVLGIDGSVEELDPPVYALRVRQTA